MSDESNVIVAEFGLPRVDPSDPIITVKKKGGFCHHKLVFDINKRTVWCKKCETVLEPFDALVHISNMWEVYAQDLEWRREEVVKAHEELDELKRQKRNLKASIRRLQKKQGSQ